MHSRANSRTVGLLVAFAAGVGCAGDSRGDGSGGVACEGASCAGRSGTPAADGGRRGEAGAGGAGATASGAGGESGAGQGGAGTGAGAAGAAGRGAGAGDRGGDGGRGGEGGTAGLSGSSSGAGSAAGGVGGNAGEACVACENYAAPEELARVQVQALDALSGLALGRKNPQIIFAHNDRARPVVYALDLQGRLRAQITLQTQATDVEDIAVGPCGSETCIFLADFGDNASARSEYSILRFVEPEISDTSSVAMSMPEFERLRFDYEDDSHNAEGFIVDPGSGKLYVVTKVAEGQPSRIYRIEEPASAGAVRRAVKVADLGVPKASDMPVSAAAAQPCGRGFVLRTYNTMYEFRIAAGAPFESAFGVEPTTLAAPTEPQSEAIDYLPDGGGIVSSGESAGAPIFVTRCQP